MPLIATCILNIITALEEKTKALPRYISLRVRHCVSGMVKCENTPVMEWKEYVITKSVVRLGCWVLDADETYSRSQG